RELFDDPQVIANGYTPELETADGTKFKLVANPVQFDETEQPLRPAPEHGQHTEEVMLELGLTWEEIAEHKERGALLRVQRAELSSSADRSPRRTRELVGATDCHGTATASSPDGNIRSIRWVVQGRKPRGLG